MEFHQSLAHEAVEKSHHVLVDGAVVAGAPPGGNVCYTAPAIAEGQDSATRLVEDQPSLGSEEDVLFAHRIPLQTRVRDQPRPRSHCGGITHRRAHCAYAWWIASSMLHRTSHLNERAAMARSCCSWVRQYRVTSSSA